MKGPSNDDQPRPRRRYSVWTLLAPAALIVFVVLLFNTLGSSCAIKDCSKHHSAAATKSSASSTSTATGTTAVPLNKLYKVKASDTAQSIASHFNLTVDQLEACNPVKLKDLHNVQLGMRLHVGSRCRSLATSTG
jgi:hypothetical protein